MKSNPERPSNIVAYMAISSFFYLASFYVSADDKSYWGDCEGACISSENRGGDELEVHSGINLDLDIEGPSSSQLNEFGLEVQAAESSDVYAEGEDESQLLAGGCIGVCWW